MIVKHKNAYRSDDRSIISAAIASVANAIANMSVRAQFPPEFALPRPLLSHRLSRRLRNVMILLHRTDITSISYHCSAGSYRPVEAERQLQRIALKVARELSFRIYQGSRQATAEQTWKHGKILYGRSLRALSIRDDKHRRRGQSARLIKLIRPIKYVRGIAQVPPASSRVEQPWF